MLLYVKPGSDQCSQVIRIAQQFPEIAILDVSKLRMRPAWIRGVPALFLAENRRHFHGTQVLHVLQRYQQQFGKQQEQSQSAPKRYTREPFSDRMQPKNMDPRSAMQAPRSSTMRPMQGRMTTPEAPPSEPIYSQNGTALQGGAPLATAMSPFHSSDETSQQLQPMTSGMSNFDMVPHEDDDPARYTADGSITEASIQDYMRQRTSEYTYT